MPIVPDPATTEWVPLYSVQTSGLVGGLPPHHATHEPGGSDPIAAIATLPHHASHEPGGADALVNAAWLNLANVFANNQEITNGGMLGFREPAQPVNLRRWGMYGYAQILNFAALLDDGTYAGAGMQIDRQGNVGVTGRVNAIDAVLSGTLTAAAAEIKGRLAISGAPYVAWMRSGMPVDGGKWHEIGSYPGDGSYRLYPVNDAENAVNGPQFIFYRNGILSCDQLGAANGLGGTPLNASQLVVGTVPDARLSTNVALKNVDNVFVAQTFASNSVISGSNSLLRWFGSENPIDQRLWRTVTYGDGHLRLEALNDAQSVVQATFNFIRDGTFNCVALNVTGAVAFAALTVNGPLTVHGGVTAQYLTASTSVVAAGRAAANGEIQADLFTSFGNIQANGAIYAAGGLGGTQLNASQLTGGTVPLGRLGTNAPSGSTYLRGDNTWQTIASAESFPSGLIVLSTSPCPAGWTRITSLDGRFLRVGNAGATGGADTHTHGLGSLSVAAHSHGGTTSTSGNHSHSLVGQNLAMDSQVQGTFTVPTMSATTDVTGNHTHSISSEGPNISGAMVAASNLPTYYEIYLCQKN